MINEPLFFVTKHSVSMCADGCMSFDINVNLCHEKAFALGSKGIVDLINDAGRIHSNQQSVSPLMATMMLEAHWNPRGEWPRKTSMAHINAARWIIDNRYVEMTDEGHRVTGKGIMWIDRIMQPPEDK